MSYSCRFILLLALFLIGLPLYTQSVVEETKSVRAMVSGIVSYTRWPAFSGPPKLCIFSSPRFSSVLKDTNAGALPYLPVIIHTEQEILVSQCDGLYFGKESLTYQVGLKSKYPTKTLLLTAGQNPEYVIGSAFCLVIKDEDTRFSVNIDSFSRNGVKVSPGILVPARSNKHR